MTTIERMHVRWSGVDEDRRDALVETLLTDALPDALSELGVGGHGEVCLRRVEVPRVVVQAADRDDDIVARWAARVAVAIADAVRSGDAVAFRSRNHALADMALHVARGRLERAWAWRAVGVWPAGVDDAVVAASVTAQTVDLAAPPAHDARLAGADELDRAMPAPAGPGAAAADRGPSGSEADRRRVPPVTSPPARLGTDSTAGGPHGDGVDAAVEQPGHRPGPGADGVAAGPARAARGAATTASPPGGEGAEWSAWDVDAAADALTLALAGSPEAVPAVLAHVARLGLWPALQARLGAERLAVLPALPDEAAAGAPRADDVVPEARTQWGGLLLLLHLVDREDPAVTRHMYALGVALLTPLLAEHERLDPRDPALLAFAGLAPDDDPPIPLAPPALLDSIGSAGAGTDTDRGDSAPDPTRVIVQVALLGLDLEHVCRRPAVIAADPGWIEACFSLDDVDVDIRRAGLDLDPGWLPWLGVVVRFGYE